GLEGDPRMKVYDVATIRNVALVGHSGSGKTQLASAILADAAMINRFGKVDEGTTVTDFDEEEVARKHTLSASLAYAEWNKQKINLVDTPGIGNFLSDARAALHVADAALVVVDAVAGAVDTARETLIEMVAEADEKLMEKFFEAGTLSDAELVAGLRSATIAGKVFPLVCTSALLNVAIQPMLDAILAYLPSPAERPFGGADKSGAEVLRKADDKAPTSAFVWKT